MDKFDRLARSVPDARDIADELITRGVRPNIGGSVHDPTDPIRRLAVHRVVDDRRAEADLALDRTAQASPSPRAEGRLRGNQPS